ncbi:GNAT family N-acetyltransferase [Actinotalea ferrariae]|uniref:GNAT family N-acetyltransferase n=1 Tax=Actinotalea ferrariae TaxID=1386098 RepID=UPI0027DF14C8|nr:GNAT family N-acetyltransferase [Actinotalea ferrariae]
MTASDLRQAQGGVPDAAAPRLATDADAEAVAELVHAAYRGAESTRGWTTESHLVGGQRADAAMVRELVAADDGVVLVLDACPEDVGTGLVACCHVERRETSAYVGMFAVRPEIQGRGLGRRMLAAAERQTLAWDRATVELTVLDHRPELLAWYERCGFRLTGVRHPFPYGDERFGLPLRTDLALLGMIKHLDHGGTP